jgi:hypothetical protein
VSAGKVDQFPDPRQDSTSLRRAGDGDSPAPLKVEDALVSKGSERPEDGVGMHSEYGRQVACGWEALARSHLTFGDVPPDLRCDLLMQRDGFVSGDLDFHDGDMQSITIMKTEADLRTELLSTDPELVIREARRRQRRRQLVIFGVVIVLIASGAIAAKATSSRSGPPVPPPMAKMPVHPAEATAPLAAPSVSAGPFVGTWRVQSTSLTIGADGTGTASWPGNVPDQATAMPNQADLRLTAVNGNHAIGVVTGSTDQAELPNGPVRLQVTNQDLLELVTSRSVTVHPLQWSHLCGASAFARYAGQYGAAIDCGA